MILSLTGTPGVGKSSIAKILENKYRVINLVKFALENNFVLGYDKERESYIIDMDGLKDKLKRTVLKSEYYILDSHLSHLIDFSDKVIVLRCRPDILRKRLKGKGWKKEKIEENVEAEILDIILSEAVEIHGIRKVFEIDTSDKTVEEVAKIIEELIEGKLDYESYRAGKIDWSEYIGGKKDAR
ncbi:MAG TPA: hypothetical protein ENI14_01200 [Thermoplasmatales archaeon]|nr:hypothetical protein [Thermoplasmatales archaeon]